MLVHLSIRNVALIERVQLELCAGFNVITGETGAGKSMLVDALSLVLGGRARPDLVRSGTEEAEVEALFDVASGSRLAAKLDGAGIPSDRELVIRRVVQSGIGEGTRQETRSRAYLNGRLSPASLLAAIAPDLCDIASQHESVSLTDPSTHAEYLDAFGELQAARSRVAEQVDALASVSRELEEVAALQRGLGERESFLRSQIGEIDDLAPREGEEAEIENERARLRNAERLKAASRRAAERLYDGDDAVCDALARVAADLGQAARVDESLASHARVVEQARADLADVARALARYDENIEASPERLARIEERAFHLHRLLQKYGPTSADILGRRGEFVKELESLANASDRAGKLEEEKARRLAEAGASARALSRGRREAAAALGEAIGAELSRLGMGRARVAVEVTRTAAASDAWLVDGARLTRTGIDRVEFLIAPNRGEEPRPLRRIASGGELSRALLALKRVLADQGPVNTYVFDEVDAGVGGAVAEVIGHAIDDIARHRQVVCITHLPQIAALAAAHFVVGKRESRGRTYASVRRMSPSERVEEIARMIGGIRVGEAARHAAIELLGAKVAG
jgi:DNA repair protein RecN (Recombination protein N)